MTGLLRRAGWGSLDDGSSLIWTISAGRRGRRWREMIAVGDAVRHSLLLETDAEGRFSHLELASAAGLWTFHPEGDGTLHGNHVDPATGAVRHIDGWAFRPDDVLLVEGSVIGAAAIAWRLQDSVAPASAIEGHGVRLDPAGTQTRDEVIRIERYSITRWQLGGGRPVEIDADGVPQLVEGHSAALEIG